MAAPNYLPYRHFDKLPANIKGAVDEAKLFTNRQGVYYKTRSGKEVWGYQINQATSFKNRMWGVVDEEIVEAYLEMVCDYVNVLEGRELIRKPEEPSLFSFGSDLFRVLRNIDEIEDAELGLSGAVEMLNKANIGGEEFLSLKHIFIPCTFYKHQALVVISPLHRRVEFFDSYSKFASRRANTVLRLIFQLLSAALGRNFIPTEWKIRTGQSPQEYYTKEDGGAYVCTNALHVALHYPVYPSAYGGEYMKRRRYRICAELIEGGIAAQPEHFGYAIDNRYSPITSILDIGVHNRNIGIFVPLVQANTIPLHKHIIGSLPLEAKERATRKRKRSSSSSSSDYLSQLASPKSSSSFSEFSVTTSGSSTKSFFTVSGSL